jgi:DNA recombination protein RmuC
MEPLTVVILFLLVAIVVGNLAGFFWLSKRQQQTPPAEQHSLTLLNQNLHGMQERLDRVSSGLNERLDNAARVIGAVSKELGAVQEIGRNMQALQDFLRSPKLRGNIGEQVLQQMLEQYFPKPLYDLQFKFQEGTIVDAILRTDSGLIPIDAKFPMENYQKLVAEQTEDGRDRARRAFIADVKKHINDIAKKYILPEQGTVDFAVMYVPSESVYYEIIRNDIDISLHGMDRKVLFVSPNSFYYFLRVLLAGMQEQKMAAAAREMIGVVRGIQQDARRFGDTLGKLDTHLSNARGAMERVNSDFTRLEGKIDRIDQIDESKLIAS